MIHFCLTFSAWWLLLLPALVTCLGVLLSERGVDEGPLLIFWGEVAFVVLLIGLVGYSLGH